MKVYVLTRDDWPDGADTMLGVYSTLDKARESRDTQAKLWEPYDMDIYEWELDVISEDYHPAGKYIEGRHG